MVNLGSPPLLARTESEPRRSPTSRSASLPAPSPGQQSLNRRLQEVNHQTPEADGWNSHHDHEGHRHKDKLEHLVLSPPDVAEHGKAQGNSRARLASKKSPIPVAPILPAESTSGRINSVMAIATTASLNATRDETQLRYAWCILSDLCSARSQRPSDLSPTNRCRLGASFDRRLATGMIGGTVTAASTPVCPRSLGTRGW